MSEYDPPAGVLEVVLEARKITKQFPGVLALDAVDASFHAGEVVAVMGENGAGKSTLMKCLAGVHQPTSGEILSGGELVQVPNVRAAEKLGIAFIHQELNLADNLSVGANIYLGREPKKLGFAGIVGDDIINKRTTKLIDQLGIGVLAEDLVQDLSIGQQQMVEIAKALSQDARIVIMDEPTSSLSLGETRRLFEIVNQLRSDGICIIFISHRIGEVYEIADRVVVLRDGKNSGNLSKSEISHDRIVSLMVGRDLQIHHKEQSDGGEVLLKASGVCTKRFPSLPVDLELKSGEVVGVAGLVGAGRTELARALFGADKKSGGTIEVLGQSRIIRSPKDAIRAGVALVPEDRKAEGIIVELSIKDNVALTNLGDNHIAGLVNDSHLSKLAETAKGELRIKAPDIDQEVGMLSGGNQQKVAIAKWTSRSPKIFLLDEPTRGIDVGSKSEIYSLIEQIANSGAAIMLISSELEEILRVSDRVLVMSEGRIAGELRGGDMVEEKIMQLATGGENKKEELHV